MVVMPIRSMSGMTVQEEKRHGVVDARIGVINDLVHEISFLCCSPAPKGASRSARHHNARYSFCNSMRAIAAVARADLILATTSSAI